MTSKTFEADLARADVTGQAERPGRVPQGTSG
jgi:hypothetical protein